MTISSFAEDKKENIWFGGHAGVCYYDGKEMTIVQRSDGTPYSEWGWMSVNTDKEGEIVVTSNKGLFKYVDKLLPSNEPGLLETPIPFQSAEVESYAIVAGKKYFELEDSKGYQWYSVEGGGLYKVKGQEITHYTKEDGLCSNNINTVIEDGNGNIWIACMQSYQPEMTNDGGICRYSPNEAESKFTQYPELEGFTKNDIYTIYEDRSGIVWFGVSGVGLYQFDGKEISFVGQTDRPDLTARFGLQDMYEESRGVTWLGFSGGLFRFEGENMINVTQEDLRRIN